jgi:hypothetical protein
LQSSITILPVEIQRRGSALSKATGDTFIELRLTRAYIRLFLVPVNDDGVRTVSLARFGNYEIRLVELSHAHASDLPPLWMELYAHNDQECIDSCACHELEEAVRIAEQLISQARELNEATP